MWERLPPFTHYPLKSSFLIGWFTLSIKQLIIWLASHRGQIYTNKGIGCSTQEYLLNEVLNMWLIVYCCLIFPEYLLLSFVDLIWTAGDIKLGIGNAKCGTWLFRRTVVLIWWWFSADHWIRKLIKPRGVDMLKVLMCRCPFSVYHTAFLSILGPNFTPKTIYLSINLLLTSPMLSSRDTESTQECPIHPFKMFQALMDEYECAFWIWDNSPFHLSCLISRSTFQQFCTTQSSYCL